MTRPFRPAIPDRYIVLIAIGRDLSNSLGSRVSPVPDAGPQTPL